MFLRYYLLNIFCLLVFIFIYVNTNKLLHDLPRKPLIDSLRIVMPAYLQSAFAFGDRYLAANIAVTRSMAFRGLEAAEEDYAVQAKIQEQAAILNPKQEDNYYLATAILAWENQVESANRVLQISGDARIWDPMPYFFKAFNLYYFERKNIAAAELLQAAAGRAQDKNKHALKSMAAKWLAGDDDPVYAINILKALYDAEQDQGLKNTLAARIQQAEGLLALREAAEKYTQDKQSLISNLEQLVDSGYIHSIPVDPIGLGYTVNQEGLPVMVSKIKRK